MRTRLWATIRKPAFSISALMAPVRLRAVASGLIMENVRSTAIKSSFMELESEVEPRRAYNVRPSVRQAERLQSYQWWCDYAGDRRTFQELAILVYGAGQNQNTPGESGWTQTPRPRASARSARRTQPATGGLTHSTA